MSRRVEREVLDGVRTEGGLLPADVLQRIAANDKALPGLAPADYHVDPPATLAEAITRSWNRLLGAWKGFKDGLAKLPPDDPAVALTRDRWLLPLFQELGYGRLTRPQPQAFQANGRDYPLSHLYHRSPIHLVGARVELGKRTAGVAGAAAAPPHGLVQEFLNQSDEHLWGFVSNGRLLRVLRDHRSLTRQAFVEFDLESIFDGEAFHAFRLLWLVCHQSRVEADKQEDCWLERWFGVARDQGVSALKKLRGGVERAIERLGAGFLKEASNARLKERLGDEAEAKTEYYRQLLRLVYRLIFLFVAEDRGVLLDPSAPPAARRRYERFYSTRRLRDLARSASSATHHGDLWDQLTVLMRQLDEGAVALALPALGSFLWSREAIPDLEASRISNRDLLLAIQELNTFSENGPRLTVNWRNVGADELGSIYESLLELSPDLDRDAGTFHLSVKGGHERKTTGSYYTPTPIVDCLLDHSLERLLDEASTKPLREAEAAILSLTVCDPACGSGHFLVAAARRIAKRLAALRGGGLEPSPEENLHALREVVSHCIYGVDLNPMAVELCKVSLWMEALEPGRPLSFLDSHVQCGNAVIGAVPGLVEGGVPDVAFEALEGDDGPCATRLRRLNKEQRRTGQLSMLAAMAADAPEAAESAQALTVAETAADDTRAGLRLRDSAWQRYLASPDFDHKRLAADTWCAAFFWPKQPGALESAAPTEGVFATLRANQQAMPPKTAEVVVSLRRHYQFFHWHLMFPKVFERGGFDLMLGNPPWDTMSPDAKEFFSAYAPEIRDQDKAQQEVTIGQLTALSDIASRWAQHRRDIFAQGHFLKSAGRFTLYAQGNLGKGDFNLFRMFVELALRFTRKSGWASQVVPEGFYSGANSSALREELLGSFALRHLFGFENARGVWFPGVHPMTKFAVYAAQRGGPTSDFVVAFGLRSLELLEKAVHGHSMTLSAQLVREFSPEALGIMEFGSQLDIDIARKMYAMWPPLNAVADGSAHRDYLRELESGHVQQFLTENSSHLPHYEGRMIAQYDHRAKGYRSGRARTATWEDLPFGHPSKSIQPQWYVPRSGLPARAKERVDQYRVGFCDVTSPTTERSLVAAMLPPGCVAGDKVPTIAMKSEHPLFDLLVWLAVANSIPMDFLVRKKVSLKMSLTIMDSLPFPRLPSTHPTARSLAARALRLCCTSPEMNALWDEFAGQGLVEPRAQANTIPGLCEREARLATAAQIDAEVAHHFRLSKEELSYMLDTFVVARKNDEKEFGTFLTKRLVLEAFDSLRNEPRVE